jgi:hypothetical protein
MTPKCGILGQMRTLIILAITLLASLTANAQECPTKDTHSFGEASRPSVLHGTLLLHDELRQWLGIKLDRPACGQKEVQLVFSKDEERRATEALRGCAVTATGKLYDSPTGYYSADMAILDATLKPDPSCRALLVELNPHAVTVLPTVTRYQASISVDYRGKGHVDVKVWQDDGKSGLLAPWQAYVNYTLTGSMDVIWFGCQEDFLIQDITQTPGSPTGIFEGEPTGTSLQDLNGVNVVKFTCQRKPKAAPSKSGYSQLQLM